MDYTCWFDLSLETRWNRIRLNWKWTKNQNESWMRQDQKLKLVCNWKKTKIRIRNRKELILSWTSTALICIKFNFPSKTNLNVFYYRMHKHSINFSGNTYFEKSNSLWEDQTRWNWLSFYQRKGNKKNNQTKIPVLQRTDRNYLKNRP